MEHASQHPDGSILIFNNLVKDELDEFSGQFFDCDFFSQRELKELKNLGVNISNVEIGREKIINIESLRKNSISKNKLPQYKTINLDNLIPPLINKGTVLEPQFITIAPIDGCNFSEFSLKYMGMFLLSSLVRYRPQLWVNSISRTAFGDDLPDDSALALIEKFLSDSLITFPNFIVQMILNKNISFN